MTQAHIGMRKGISLVEMIVAIILFAALATIGLKYTKLFLNTDMQAKKARIAALTDQATQLSQAYQIFKNETGEAPALITDLNGSAAIMTEIPFGITEIGGTSAVWAYVPATTITKYPHAFTFAIAASTDNSDELYCALYNREFNTSADLNVTEGDLIYDAASIADAYTASGNKKQFCYSNATNNFTVVSLLP